MTEKIETKNVKESGTAAAKAASAPSISAALQLEPYIAYRDGERYREDVFVAVNGVGYRIKRGETVMIPRNVALVLEQSIAQDCASAADTAVSL